jgi:hypothetical protein
MKSYEIKAPSVYRQTSLCSGSSNKRLTSLPHHISVTQQINFGSHAMKSYEIKAPSVYRQTSSLAISEIIENLNYFSVQRRTT